MLPDSAGWIPLTPGYLNNLILIYLIDRLLGCLTDRTQGKSRRLMTLYLSP